MQTLVLTCMIWFFPDPLALPTEYMDLLNLCIRSTNFQYNSKLYEQLQDTVIRFPLSAVVAEIVKQNIEESALSTRRQSIPLSLRYVDETPPQDTTKSTHSTTSLTEKNSDTEQFTRRHGLNGGLHVKHLEYLCSLDHGVLVIEKCHDAALIMLSLQFQVTF